MNHGFLLSTEEAFPWKTLKADIGAKLSRTDRLELAQQVWGNIVKNGYDPAPGCRGQNGVFSLLSQFDPLFL